MTPIDELLPYAGNARTHSDAQISQIAASIAEFGFTNPILAGGDNVIIAGHELIYWFGRLVKGAGGFGEAMALLKNVAVEVWDRIKLGGKSLRLALAPSTKPLTLPRKSQRFLAMPLRQILSSTAKR